MRRIIYAVLIWGMVISLGIVGCVKQEKTIKIGALLPLTGPSANHGQDAKEGMNLALKEIRNSDKILGNKIEIIWEDDNSTPQGAISGAQKLINIDKVAVIIGPISSSATLAVAPLAEKSKVVLLSPSASSPEISDAGDFIFRNSLLAPPQGKKMAQFCFENLKITKVDVLFLNDDTGWGYYNSFKQNFESLGGKINLVENYDKTDTDFRPQIIKLKKDGAKAVYVPSVPQTMGLILKQSAELGYNPIFLANIGVEGEDLLKIAGEKAEGIYYTSLIVNEKFLGFTEK